MLTGDTFTSTLNIFSTVNWVLLLLFTIATFSEKVNKDYANVIM